MQIFCIPSHLAPPRSSGTRAAQHNVDLMSGHNILNVGDRQAFGGQNIGSYLLAVVKCARGWDRRLGWFPCELLIRIHSLGVLISFAWECSSEIYASLRQGSDHCQFIYYNQVIRAELQQGSARANRILFSAPFNFPISPCLQCLHAWPFIIIDLVIEWHNRQSLL